MPLQVPVFKRELMNKMYGPTVYFFARITSGMIVQIFYPIIMALLVFFVLKIDESAENFFRFLCLAIQINLVGCGLGYLAGVAFDNDDQARSLAVFLQLLFMLTAGGLNNASSYPVVIEQISYISPNRYAVEGFFRCVTRNMDLPPSYDLDEVYDSLGYTNGDIVVHCVLLGLFFLFVFLGWLVIFLRNRKY